MKTKRIFSPAQIYYSKVLCIAVAIIFLMVKSEQHFANPVIVLTLVCGGFYFGKITCSTHLKNTTLGITLLIFILMNLVHSLLDGISFVGQSYFYWLSAIGMHEVIRQPTLYIILWAILRPFATNNYFKIVICLLSITGTWLFGIWLGMIGGSSISRASDVEEWMRYSIFLFIGDVAHHLVDQYKVHREKGNNS